MKMHTKRGKIQIELENAAHEGYLIKDPVFKSTGCQS